MGQTWSKFMPGHSEADITPPVPETEVGPSTPDPNVPQSEASTEASSSVPIYQGDPFSVAGADVELSSLKDEESEEEERDQERGKETQTTPTPTPSTSQHLSPLQAFLKGPEKLAHLKKSQQASPSTGLQKMYSRKSRAFKQPRPSSPRLIQQHHAPKLAAESAKRVRTQQKSSTPGSPPELSPSPVAPEDEALEVDDEGETASQSLVPEPEDDVKVESEEDLMQPSLHSSAQKLLLFELDRKRKAPAGLPSLAVECMGESRMKLKARTSLEKSRDNSEGGPRKRVMDLGEGEAAVGRRMKKAVGSRRISEGHVASYDVSSRLYQIEYDNGKEETMEWLDLEPCLVEQSKTVSAPVEVVKGTTTLRKSLRLNAARAKKVEEFVYTKRTRGRPRKK